MILFYALFVVLFPMPTMLSLTDDPAPGLFTSIETSRRYECRRIAPDALRRDNPGVIEAPNDRGDFIEEAAVICDEPAMGADERHPRDTAVLAGLSATTRSVARQLAARAGADARTWLVEVHYPEPTAVSKISFATKAELMQEGLRVTDRLPVLAVGDVEVLSRTPPLEAYPLACKRYFAKGRLEASDAVLSLLVLDSRETTLHAGLCEEGRWTWLQ